MKMVYSMATIIGFVGLVPQSHAIAYCPRNPRPSHALAASDYVDSNLQPLTNPLSPYDLNCKVNAEFVAKHAAEVAVILDTDYQHEPYCSGVAITDRVILTARHCDVEPYDKVRFGWVSGSVWDGPILTVSKVIEAAPQRGLDYMLVEVSTSITRAGGKIATLAMEFREADSDPAAYLGYPDGRDLTVGTGYRTVHYTNDVLLNNYQGNMSHNLPTMGGSSGSPIYRPFDGGVIGIHSGFTEKSWWVDGGPQSGAERGVTISEIRRKSFWMRARFPNHGRRLPWRDPAGEPYCGDFEGGVNWPPPADSALAPRGFMPHMYQSNGTPDALFAGPYQWGGQRCGGVCTNTYGDNPMCAY